MRIFKNLKKATMVSILFTSFMFLSPGAGTSEAGAYEHHFKPDHVKRAQVKQTYKHGYHNNAGRQRGKHFTQRTVTTTRYSTRRGAAQPHADKSCRTNTSRPRRNYIHLGHNSFKHHQKLHQSNFKHQRRSQQHVKRNLGEFAALPGIIVSIPL